MKKTGIAVAVVVAFGVAGTVGAWYTGTQMEDVLRDAVAQSNEQIEEAFPDGSVRLEMTTFERGIFSSSARYELVYPGHEDEGPRSITVVDHLEHGPFPLSHLQKFKLMPVMASSKAMLERSDDLEPLFAASGGQPPVIVNSTLDYNNNIDGTINVAALVFNNEFATADLAPVALEFATDIEGNQMVLEGTWEGVRIASNPGAEESFKLEMSGVTLFVDQQRGAAGIYLGEGRMAVATVRLQSQGGGIVMLEGLTQSTTLGEDGGNLAGGVDFQLAKVSYEDQELGSAGMKWSFSRIDQAAAVEINDIYNETTMAVYRGEQPPDQSERWRDAFTALLAAQPQLALDLLVIRTPNGESRARAEIQLASPESFDLPAQELVPQLLSRIDAHVQLSRPMLRDMVMYKTLFKPDADPELVALEAQLVVEMLAAMAENTRLARKEGDNLVTNLTFANGAFELNGEVIPPEALLAMLVLFSPASPATEAE